MPAKVPLRQIFPFSQVLTELGEIAQNKTLCFPCTLSSAHKSSQLPVPKGSSLQQRFSISLSLGRRWQREVAAFHAAQDMCSRPTFPWWVWQERMGRVSSPALIPASPSTYLISNTPARGAEEEVNGGVGGERPRGATRLHSSTLRNMRWKRRASALCTWKTATGRTLKSSCRISFLC